MNSESVYKAAHLKQTRNRQSILHGSPATWIPKVTRQLISWPKKQRNTDPAISKCFLNSCTINSPPVCQQPYGTSKNKPKKAKYKKWWKRSTRLKNRPQLPSPSFIKATKDLNRRQVLIQMRTGHVALINTYAKHTEATHSNVHIAQTPTRM
jgi:hypothetical protein